jgi:signal transduction histidine kinase
MSEAVRERALRAVQSIAQHPTEPLTVSDAQRRAKVARILDNPPGYGVDGYMAVLDAALERARRRVFGFRDLPSNQWQRSRL